MGYLEGTGKVILHEPQALLTEAAKMPGLDGQKMSKSYNNYIGLREDPDSVSLKIKRMPTDPARVRLSDPGQPSQCPVWQFHLLYSDDATKALVETGCTTAGIGCLECKKPVIDAVIAEQEQIIARARNYEDNPDMVRSILNDGAEVAEDAARQTLIEVRQAMGLQYR